MNETMKMRKWWWPWQTEKIEQLLEGKAREGWVLAKTNDTCTKFVFERQAPASIRYCLDYQEKEKPEYLSLMADDGWKREYKGTGWFLWSKPYSGERPELYTDRDSLIRRSNAILGSLCAVLAAQIPLAVVILRDMAGKSPFAMVLLVIWGIIIAVLAGTTVGMAAGTAKLRRQGKRSGKTLV